MRNIWGLPYENAELLKDMIAGQLTQDDTEKLEYFYLVRKNNILHIQCNVYNITQNPQILLSIIKKLDDLVSIS